MNKKKVFFLVGLPGSGKSTLTKYLSDNLSFSVISSNTILEEDNLLNGDYLKNTYVDHGISIPDDLYVYLVTKRIKKDSNDMFIIEGFPYNLNQLKLSEKMLKQTNSKLCGVIYLKEKDDVLYKRLINRKVCPKCNQSFNNIVDLCPDCNIKTIKRDDDEIEIINKRMQTQKQSLQEVISYYLNTNKLLVFDNMNLKDVDIEMQKIKTLYKKK